MSPLQVTVYFIDYFLITHISISVLAAWLGSVSGWLVGNFLYAKNPENTAMRCRNTNTCSYSHH